GVGTMRCELDRGDEAEFYTGVLSVWWVHSAGLPGRNTLLGMKTAPILDCDFYDSGSARNSYQ
ncbi:MAG: hypothetical protein VX519_06680, partial [Myxococcota bacterium]|nr:hypothetical protein [Myxococcota bacterium]